MGFVDKVDVLSDRVRVELSMSLAEIIAGVSDDIERLSGEAGLLMAEEQFRRIRGCRLIPRLIAVLNQKMHQVECPSKAE